MSDPQFELATFELYHSRPIAPTRRLALGLQYLPANPAPGPGGILLGGIVARFVGDLDEDDVEALDVLMSNVESGRRILQPRLRHRLQTDRVGLLRSTHQLRAEGDGPVFRIASAGGSPMVNVLGAVYAAGNLPPAVRPAVFAALRRALRWQGPIGPALITQLTGSSERVGWMTSASDPVTWALVLLGFGADDEPSKREIRKRWREQLRLAHPDHGGEESAAAERIADLGEARRILLD